jgi:hypothetical protein
MLQVLLPRYAMDVQIIRKYFQELLHPTLKDLCHVTHKCACHFLQSKRYNSPIKQFETW